MLFVTLVDNDETRRALSLRCPKPPVDLMPLAHGARSQSFDLTDDLKRARRYDGESMLVSVQLNRLDSSELCERRAVSVSIWRFILHAAPGSRSTAKAVGRNGVSRAVNMVTHS